MLIDCDRCAMRDVACDDCVVSVLLGSPDSGHDVGPPAAEWAREIEVDPTERAAIAALVDAGLIASPTVAYVTHDDGIRLLRNDIATDRRHAVG
jgi:hypothetical protein